MLFGYFLCIRGKEILRYVFTNVRKRKKGGAGGFPLLATFLKRYKLNGTVRTSSYLQEGDGLDDLL